MDLDVFDLFGSPVVCERDVSRWGAPAASVPYGGMPAYESETGALLVMECLIVYSGAGPDRSLPRALPRSYGMVALRAPSGLAALHDDPDAVWSWRPLLYDIRFSGTQKFGSQQELGWRIGLHQAELAKSETNDRIYAFIEQQVRRSDARHGRRPSRLPKNARKRMFREYAAFVGALNDEPRPTLPFEEANQRARALLVEQLSVQQRLEFAARGYFYVRGTINRLYRVTPGNGLAIMRPETREEQVSLCLHTDEWIPDDDNALAAKLLIESGPDGEKELLEGAKPRLVRARRQPSASDRRAWKLEQRLLPAPLPG